MPVTRYAHCLLDLDSIRGEDGEVLGVLHRRVGDDHAGEMCVAAGRPGSGVFTEARDFGQVEVEDVLPPVHGVPDSQPVSMRM